MMLNIIQTDRQREQERQREGQRGESWLGWGGGWGVEKERD